MSYPGTFPCAWSPANNKTWAEGVREGPNDKGKNEIYQGSVMKRTTVVLEDPLFKAVKKLAVENDSTIQQIVAEALRRYVGWSSASSKETISRKDPFLCVREVDFVDPHLSERVDEVLYGPES